MNLLLEEQQAFDLFIVFSQILSLSSKINVHWNGSGFMDTLHLELSATGTDVQTTTVFPYFMTVGALYEQQWDLR